MNEQIPTVQHQQLVKKLSQQLRIPGLDIFAVYIYLNNGEFSWLTNCPPAAKAYAESGLKRADILQSKQFRRGNRVIFTDEYAEIDPIQKQITQLMRDNNFFRVYCLSRFCSDGSLLFAANRKGSKEEKPLEFYHKTVTEFENFCVYFIDNTIDIFIKELPTLKNTRFAKDANFRRIVIKNRTDPPIEVLSKGEIDVLYWAALGKTAEETSMILGLSKHTLETYRKRAISKLNAANITHAVYLASLYNLIV